MAARPNSPGDFPGNGGGRPAGSGRLGPFCERCDRSRYQLKKARGDPAVTYELDLLGNGSNKDGARENIKNVAPDGVR